MKVNTIKKINYNGMNYTYNVEDKIIRFPQLGTVGVGVFHNDDGKELNENQLKTIIENTLIEHYYTTPISEWVGSFDDEGVTLWKDDDFELIYMGELTNGKFSFLLQNLHCVEDNIEESFSGNELTMGEIPTILMMKYEVSK